MAVKIRLTRLGKKKQPSYRVVVMDSRKQRDGKYIEQLGFYDPKQNPSVVEIDNERALHWLRVGAQPTERAQKLLEISGAWTQFRVARGDIHTIGSDAPQDAPEPRAEAVVEEIAHDAAKEAAQDVAEATETAEAIVDDAVAKAADAGTTEAVGVVESSEES